MTADHDNFTFDKTRRIVRKSDFQRIFAARCTAADRLLAVYVASNNLEHPRLGITIGRKHGNAVQRNRLRRLLRKAFRLEQHNLAGGLDYLLLPRPVPPASLADYRQIFVRLARDAAKRWHARSQRPATVTCHGFAGEGLLLMRRLPISRRLPSAVPSFPEPSPSGPVPSFRLLLTDRRSFTR